MPALPSHPAANEAMHILWLTEHAHPGRGGMAASCERLVSGLRRAGARVDIVQLTGGAGDVQCQVELGGERIFAPLGDDAAHGMHALWVHLQACARPWTHVVAFGGQQPLIAAPVLAAWLGLPLLTLLRGNDFDTAVFQPLRLAALTNALTRSVAVLTVSHDMQQRVSALYPGLNVTTAANGIALQHWQALPSDRSRAAAWRASAVTPGCCVLGVFGQIKAKKGALLLLETLAAADLAPHFHLLFIGELDQAVHDYLETHPQISASVKAALDRDQLIPWYLACDAVALPSLYDGMPNVLLEAGALGVPVIAARAGGIPDVMQDARHGWLFAPGDREACGAALAHFLATPAEQRVRTGQQLRKRIAVEFTSEREADALLTVLNAVARRDSHTEKTAPAALTSR